jgi:hypothetical protein
LRVLVRTSWLGRGKRYSIAELRPADAPSIACPSDVGALLFRRAQAFF